MRILALPFAFLATPLWADACVTGTWAADLGDIAALLGDQMQGQAESVSGSVTMQVGDTGALRMTVNDWVVRVTLSGIPPMDVQVTGYSAGALTTADGNWTVMVDDYALVGSANAMGQTMSIPFQSSDGLLGSGSGTYTCAGPTLTFMSDDATARIPRDWSQVD